MAEGSVNPTLAEVLLILLVVFSLIFEFCLHRLEHWITKQHAYLTPALKIIYRELMVLGLVSFIFIMYTTIAKPSGDTVLSFEFAHVFIFLLAIIYTVIALISLFTSLRLSTRWKRMENIDLDTYIRSKDEYTSLRLRMHQHRNPLWRGFSWWFPNVATLSRYRHLHELMAFHDMRFQFIFYRKLPESFRFSSFLRKIKSYTFIKLVESHWTLYVLLLLTAALDIVRRELNGTKVVTHKASDEADHLLNTAVRVGDGDDDDKKDDESFGSDVIESAWFITAAIGLSILVQILALKIRKIYWDLTKNPRMYYEDVTGRFSGGSPAVGSSGETGGYSSSSSAPLGLQNPAQAKAILTDESSGNLRGQSRTFGFDRKDMSMFEEDPSASSSALEDGGSTPRQRGVAFAVYDDIESGTSTGKEDMQNAFVKHKSLAVTNKTLADNMEEQQKAQEAEARKYPWIIRKLIPRVNRVASSAEKKFWFGSPNFFFWLVEFTLFFSTVLLAAVCASVFLLAVEKNPISDLHIVSLVLAGLNLVFSQVRIAGIMKKYTFVLLNASLVPESLAEETLEHMRKKRKLDGGKSGKRRKEEEVGRDDDDDEDDGDYSDSETRESHQRGLERRKTVAQFMMREASKGKIPGVSSSAVVEGSY